MKKTLVSGTALSLLLASTTLAAGTVFVQDKSGVVTDKLTYDDSSVVKNIKLNLYCGYTYLFTSKTCKVPVVQVPVATNTGAGATPTVDYAAIQAEIDRKVAAGLKNNIQQPGAAPVQPTVINRTGGTQVVYQVIEKAVPGPQGPVGPQGPQGPAGASGAAGSGGFYTNYVSGGQYNGAVPTNPTFQSVTSGSVNTGSLTATGNSNLATTTVTSLSATNFAAATVTASTTNTDNLAATNATTTNLIFTNGTGTNLVTTNSTSTNGFFTNLMATLANFTNLLFGNATGTNITATGTANLANIVGTNATITNSTSTNLFSTNASITNATTSNFFTNVFSALSAYISNLLFDNATGTNITATGTANLATVNSNNITTSNLTATGTTALATTTINGDLTTSGTNILGGQTNLTNASATNLSVSGNTNLGSIASGTATNTLLVNDGSGNVRQITAAEMLASNTTNIIVYGNDTSNTITSTVNGVVSSTTISSLNNVNLTGTTTAATITAQQVDTNGLTATNATITNSTSTNLFSTNASITNATTSNFFTNIFSALTAYISNLLFDNATGTNITATGTANLANIVGTNATITNFVGTNSTTTNLSSSNSLIGAATATSLNVSGDTALGTTTISGPLTATNTTLNGTTTFNGVVDLSNASVTMPSNATFTNIVWGNATGTNTYTQNLTADNATLTNATSTNFFASALSALSAFIDNLLFNNATGTNITATGTANLANIVGNTASITSATITNLSVPVSATTSGNVLTTNIGGSVATSAVVTSNTVSYASTTNTLTSSVNGVVGTTTIDGLTDVDLMGTTTVTGTTTFNGAVDFSNASVTGLAMDAATITNLVATNASITNATTSNFFTNMLSALSAYISNLLFDNATGTNITATGTANLANIVGTNATVTNLNSTNSVLGTATATSLSVTGTTNLGTVPAGSATSSILTYGPNGEVQQVTPVAILASNTTNLISYATATNLITSTVNGVVATTTIDFSSINSNLVPSLDNTYDLGTPQLRWRDLWLGPGSLKISSTPGTSGTGSNYTQAESGFQTTSRYVSQTTNFGTQMAGNFGGMEFRSDMNVGQGANSAFVFQGKKNLGAGDQLFAISDNGGLDQHVTVLGNGNVGIGTSTPGNALTVASSSGSVSGLRLGLTSATSAGSNSGKVLSVDTNGDVVLVNSTPSSASFETLTVSSSTAAKVATFTGDIDVTGTIDPTRILFSNLAGVNSPTYNPSANGNNYSMDFTDGGLNFKSNAANNILQLNNNGNVGIGIANPIVKMQVNGDFSYGGDASNIHVYGSNNATDAWLDFKQNSSTIGANIGYDFANGRMFINTGGTDNTIINTGGGNVGIGAVAPATKLHVLGIITGERSLGASPSNDPDLSLLATFRNTNKSGDPRIFDITTDSNNTAILRSVNSNMALIGGNVGIGTNAPAFKTEIVTGGYNDGLHIKDPTNTVFGGMFVENGNMHVLTRSGHPLVLGAGNGGRMTVHTNGIIQLLQYGGGTLNVDSSGNIFVSSDERLKNIEGLFVRGLEDIKKINPINYYWNEESHLDRTHAYSGFSAQNVQSAIPEAVDTDPRGYLTLSERPILAAVVNAIKEIAAKIEKMAIDFVTKKVTTESLCVGTETDRTCVDKNQFDQIIQNNPSIIIQQSSQPSTQDSNWSDSSASTTDMSTTTPDTAGVPQTSTTTENTIPATDEQTPNPETTSGTTSQPTEQSVEPGM